MKRFKEIFLTVLAIMTVSAPAVASQSAYRTGHEMLWLGPVVIGAVVSASTLVGLQKSFRALFLQSFDAVTPSWEKHVMETQSTHAAEIYQWLGRVAALREWIDTKSLDRLRGFDFTITNKDWESTIAVDRNHIEDDMLGLYRPRIQELGVRGKQHPNKLLSEVRRDGSSKKCYDGQNFYATGHKEGKSGTQSNLLTGTGTTVAKLRDDLFSAKEKLRTYKDDQGEPFIEEMGNLDVVAVIPAGLEKGFEELNNPAPGATVPKTPIPYEIDPRLSDANDWYLDYVALPLRPFIKQNRTPIDFVALDNPNQTETVFMRKKFYYGVEGRYNVGYGLWQLSIKTTNT